MFVPATPRYLSEEDVAAIRPGDQLNTDSGMGGSFSLEFVEHNNDQFVFKMVSPGFESWGPFSYTFDEVRTSVYDLIAENSCFRELESSFTKNNQPVDQTFD